MQAAGVAAIEFLSSPAGIAQIALFSLLSTGVVAAVFFSIDERVRTVGGGSAETSTSHRRPQPTSTTRGSVARRCNSATSMDTSNSRGDRPRGHMWARWPVEESTAVVTSQRPSARPRSRRTRDIRNAPRPPPRGRRPRRRRSLDTSFCSLCPLRPVGNRRVFVPFRVL